MSDDDTVHSLNSLDIAMPCFKQAGWHDADDRKLITTNRFKTRLGLVTKDLGIDLDFQKKKGLVSISGNQSPCH